MSSIITKRSSRLAEKRTDEFYKSFNKLKNLLPYVMRNSVCSPDIRTKYITDIYIELYKLFILQNDQDIYLTNDSCFKNMKNLFLTPFKRVPITLKELDNCKEFVGIKRARLLKFHLNRYAQLYKSIQEKNIYKAILFVKVFNETRLPECILSIIMEYYFW